MTKTNYEKELEREIDNYEKHCEKYSHPWKIEDLEGEDSPFPDLIELIKLKAKLEGYKKGKEEIKEEIYKLENKRINFIMPNKQGSSLFATAWFCHGLNLTKQFNFVDLEEQKENE